MANEKPLTLAEARNLLYKHVTCDQSDACGEFRLALNEALERIYSDGVWDGLMVRADVSGYITDNVLTLPYAYDAMLAIALDDHPYDIFSEEHEFSQNGPAVQDAGEGGCIVIDLGFNEVSEESVRQYKLTMDSTDFDTIEGLLKKRFVYLENDTDLIYPANIGALKHALLAICFENESDIQRAQAYWEQAYSILNSEKAVNNIGVKRPLPQSPWGMGLPKPDSLL
jgi:hypothetical protein